MKKLIFFTVILLFLSACSSKHKPLDSPCTYKNRAACGATVPMQQGVPG